MRAEEYEFCIDAFSPEKIPLSRLAEYLIELGKLLGNDESVHFHKLKEGSTRIVTRIEHEAVPKVQARIQNAIDPEAPEDVRKPFQRINELLRADNAVGKLEHGGDKSKNRSAIILRFPGREAVRQPKMG